MKTISKNLDGFSLLEVLIVVAITAILVTLAVSSMQAMSLGQQRKAAASEISSLLNQGRFLARGTSNRVAVAVTTVGTSTGGSVIATIGAPVNWTESVTFGSNARYPNLGLWDATPGTATFTLMPKGTVSPGGFVLRVRDKEYSDNNQEVSINVSLLGDITVTP